MSELTLNIAKEHIGKSATIDIIERAYLDIKAIEGLGKIDSIVDDDDNPRDNTLYKDGLLIDTITMDALKEFFNNAGVGFVGHPWTTQNQEDYLGDISISCEDLNQALQSGRLVLSRTTENSDYSFEGLSQFVDKFIEDHQWEAKYDESEHEEVPDDEES